MRTRFVLVTVLCLASSGLHAREWFEERRIGTGVDFVHQQGMPMVSVELSPVSVLAWETYAGVGLTYSFGSRVGWNASLGGILVDRVDGDVGTHLNLLFRLSRCDRNICLSFAHVSHGSAIGIEIDKPNSGLNFLFLEYRQR
jgi:hypothetical protein